MALNNILQADEIGVYGILKRDGGDGKVAYAELVYDTTQEKFLSEINKDNKDYKDTIEAHFNNTSNPHKVTKEQVGLSEVTNDAQVKRSEMGLPLGVATLDNKGKVLANLLPSFVDDVLEFEDKSVFPDVGESGKIYVALDNNLTYRWSGSAYIEISQSLAIGDTDTTAYQGSKGKKLELDLTDEITRAKAEEAKKYIKPEDGIPSSDLSANVVADIANKGVINIGTPSADTTIVSIPVSYPTSTLNISINGASEDKAGVLVSSDKAKLNRFEELLSSDEIKQIGSSLTQDDVTNVLFQLEKIQELYKQADDTIKGAETVDAELNGNILIVTRRDGSKLQVNLTDSDEHVTVNVTTTLTSVSVEGIILNVYINNGADPQQYTTDGNGQVVFTVTKGSTYKVVFPYIEGCAILNPVQHVASVGNRIIDANYIAETEKMERLTIKMSKADESGIVTPWEGGKAYVTIAGKRTEYIMDADGRAVVEIKNGTSYTVSVDKIDGMYEQYDRYSITRTAIAESYRFNFIYRPYESGIWLIDNNNKQWTYDDWEASGNDNSKLMFVRIATLETQYYKGDILISIDKMADFSKVAITKQWCDQNVEFKNIPLNGLDINNPNWSRFAYNGLLATQTIIAECDERGLTTAVADYCYSSTIMNGDKLYQGYLPTVYQWKLTWQNMDIVIDAISKKYPDLNVNKNAFSGNKWTSTQMSATNSYYFTTAVNNFFKIVSYLAIPFYACLSDSPSLLSLQDEQDGSLVQTA